MKRLSLLIFFFGITVISFSQRVYFIYIQSEADQPFYLKMKERVYSSTSKGYLILSNLHDSSYVFFLGFPGQNIMEQQFSVSMNSKDHGYLLRNFNEKGWGLFDLQNMSVQMSRSNEKTGIDIKKEPVKKDESTFTQILAKASDDSTLLEKPDLAQIQEKKDILKDVIKEPEAKVEEKKEIKTQETIDEKKADKPEEKPVVKIEQPQIINKDEAISKNQDVKPEQQSYKKSEVVRQSETFTGEGLGIIFIDESGDGKKDTIQIIIPQAKEIADPENRETGQGKKFLDIDTIKQEEAAKLIKEDKDADQSQAAAKTIKKNNCTSVADETVFFKLRKKMAGIPGDDNMISEARKTFKTKCFSTEQIKNLSALFLSDGGKYKFFDTAYEHVSDIENFSSLQSELKSEYYVNRFKAMLR